MIRCMKKHEKDLSRKEHFSHQGNIKEMVRQQNKMVTSPLLPPAEKKTAKCEGGSSLTRTMTITEWEDLLQEKIITFKLPSSTTSVCITRKVFFVAKSLLMRISYPLDIAIT